MAGLVVSALGLARSVATYHGNRARHRRMRELHARFLGSDSLAFDIGAHVGDRVAAFRALGARVVAVEPQSGPTAVMRTLHGRDRNVTLLKAAVSDRRGAARLLVNRANPTVSTLSPKFVAAADGAPGWEGQAWDGAADVETTTLDLLIDEYGSPDFIKIDVEGHEDAVLAGLSRQVPALSFEVTMIRREIVKDCLDRLLGLGMARFNVSLGEDHGFVFPVDVDAATLRRYLDGLPDEANSGDVYAMAGTPSQNRRGVTPTMEPE